ncbi:MAG: helix-turn-helix domain-containing protein [Dysosmobacter sp.]|nr:helix-turn-helix domain-containing protein [Dysosmobacter sp.]
MTGNKFPERLRRLRESTRRKQYAVAECVGITRSTLRRYARGKLEPTRQPLIDIADYFDVSIDYLLGRTDNPKMNK